jgi:hypothetical protein
MFPGHVTPVAAAGFVGLLSLFNLMGRFFWTSTSDIIGRKNTYFCFFVIGRCSTAWCQGRARPAASRCSYCVSSSSSAYTAAALYRTGLSQGHVRHALCRRHSRHATHRMVSGRHFRSGAGQLYPRVSDRAPHSEGASLQHHHVHHGGALAIGFKAMRPCEPPHAWVQSAGPQVRDTEDVRCRMKSKIGQRR